MGGAAPVVLVEGLDDVCRLHLGHVCQGAGDDESLDLAGSAGLYDDLSLLLNFFLVARLVGGGIRRH